jgi:HAE1 family hydrophobic/amphiphilic exporter-1
MRLRWSVPRRIQRCRENPGLDARGKVLQQRGWLQLAQLRQDQLRAFYFVMLKPWSDRKTRAEQYQEIKARLNQQLSRLPQGTVFSFSPPAIPGVGTSGGFQFVLEDRAGRDVQFLADNLAKFMAAVRKRPEIGTVSTTFLPSVPQQFVDVDREKVLKQGVAISDVYRTIQAFMGGQFINYFNEFGRTWQVYVEAEAPYRSNLENLGQFYVRNNSGETLPLSTLEVRVAHRPRVHHALQRVSSHANHRQRCARL